MKQLLLKGIRRQFGKLIIQDKGSIAILTGLLLVACVGFAALAIDVGIWYSQKRKLQLAADAGAVGGALALRNTGKSTMVSYVNHDLALNGCTAANNCTVVAINNPPASGPNTSNPTAVEVILSKPATLYLAGLFLSTAPTLQARAVAKGGSIFDNCFVALGSQGIGLVGGATINASTCSLYSNSDISGKGNSSITAKKVSAVGTITATVNPAQATFPGSTPLVDPLANLQIPSYSGCNYTNYSGTPSSISPGVFCGGFSAHGVVNMAPGTYIIDGGTFDLHGGAVLNGTGVTIILTSHTGTNYPSINDAGGNTLNLTAPTTGPFAGVAFFEDRNAPAGSIKFAGGATDNVNGAMYFPTQDVTFTGNSTTIGNSCVQFIANSITVKGNASAAAGVCGASAGSPALIE